MEIDIKNTEDTDDNEDTEDTDDNEDTEDTQKHPIIKAKMCKRLTRELGLDEIVYGFPELIYNEPSDWKPPINYGLENCNVIIPSYYKFHKNPTQIVEIDYYFIIKDDIRNLRPLNEYQLKYIKNLSHEYKNELFDIFTPFNISNADYL
jgi:hypothetical protein